MKLYTRGGDQGETSLIGGRTMKDDPRVEAYGTIDELNSFTGQAVACLEGQELLADLKQMLIMIQHELFDCGADLAYAKQGFSLKITSAAVEQLEGWIDQLTEEAPDLTKFILPGGTTAASVLHICRTVCRRAERRIITARKQHPLSEQVLAYINRLSDFYFAAARIANARKGIIDVAYERSADVFRLKGK